MIAEADAVPLPLDTLANKTCPSSSETTKKGLARNPDKLYGYVKTFYDGIQILQADPANSALVQKMTQAILMAGDAVVNTRIEITPQQWGWNNLSSSWDAWGNGTCSDVNTPNVYASAKALLTLQAAFELTRDNAKRPVYYDAFVRGANYWLDFTPNPLLDTGSSYSVKTKKWGTLNAAGIKTYFASKPNNIIFKNVIVGGQRTDYCPGPGCTDAEKSLNDALSSPTALTLPRPFRFHYTKDDPGLVTVNCSALMGLAFLKMGLTLREMNAPQYPLPLFTVPLRSKDGSRTAVSERDVYYIGYWTLYSDHYNLAQTPANASYYDVDTPLYFDVSYENHLATISSPVLAEAGALLKRTDYLEAAVRSIKENKTFIDPDWTAGMYAYCTLQNLDNDFRTACAALAKKNIYLNYNYLGVAITQFITWDLTLPSASLTAPTGGRVFSSMGTVPVAANALDNTGVAEVFFLRDGVTVAIDTVAPFGLNWTVSPDQNGAHVWTAVARDAGGNRKASPPVAVQVAIDVSSPTVTLTSPFEDATVTTPGLFPIAANAFDDLGVAKVWFEVDGVAVATAIPPAVSYSWPVNHLDNGTRTLTATAFDTSGKKATSRPVTVRVNIPVPVFDTFDGETPGAPPKLWNTVQNAGTEVLADSATFHGAAGLSVRLEDNSSTGYCQIQKSVPPMGTFFFKGSFRFSDVDKKHYVFLGTGDKSSLYLLYALNGRWMKYDGTSETRLPGDTAGYAPGRWYEVEIEGNFIAGVYSVWIDGTAIGTNLPLPPGNSQMAGFRILPAPASLTGRLWADDVYFASVRPPTDILGPRLSPVSISNITETSAEISWTTDEPAAARIEFGASPDMGRNLEPNPGRLTSHRGLLTALDSGTLHRVRVLCVDDAGNTTVSADQTFSTLLDTTPPAAIMTLSGSIEPIRWEQTRELSVAASDNVKVSRVQFLREGVVVATATTAPYVHTWNVTHLDNSLSSWTARAFDTAGNRADASPLAVTVDIPAPFSDDFEGDAPGSAPARWSVTAQSNAQVTVVDTEPLGRAGHAALLSDLSTANYCQIQRRGAAMERAYFRASVRFESTVGKHFIFLGDGDKGSVYFLTAKYGLWTAYNGTVEYRLEGDQDGYRAGTWYDVEVAVDFTAGVYDVWVNGRRIGQNIPVPGGNKNLSGFRSLPASATLTGKIWIDDVYFATAKPSGEPLQAPHAAPTHQILPPPSKPANAPRAYPVPFRPGRGALGITFDGLPAGARITILSADGRHVRTLTTGGAEKVVWDVTNDDGSPVAPGVYAAAVVDNDGQRRQIKVMVDR